MRDRRLRLATVALALCGAAIAAYLSYARLGDVGIICPTTGCGTVQRSPYAELAGVPVAYLGVIAYLAIAAAACIPGPAARILTSVLVLAATVFAGYLLIAQLVLIDAVCAWCLASDGVLLGLLSVVMLRRSCNRKSAPSRQDGVWTAGRSRRRLVSPGPQ